MMHDFPRDERPNACFSSDHRARLRDRHARVWHERSCRTAVGDAEGLGSIAIERGSMDDFHRLAQMHYRKNAPGAVVAVYVARASGDGCLASEVDVTRRFARMNAHSSASCSSSAVPMSQPVRTLGVLVVSMPVLHGSLRDVATGGRYVGLTPRDRAAFVNREVRTISRVVVDPRCRGLGVATRLVLHVLDHASTVYTEAWASMGRVSPFFARAGMARFDAPATAAQARLRDALAELDLQPCDLARPSRVQSRLRHASREEQTWFDAELRRFIHFGRPWVRPRRCEGEGHGTNDRVSDATRRAWMADAWRAAWQRPVYYLARRGRGEGDQQ